MVSGWPYRILPTFPPDSINQNVSVVNLDGGRFTFNGSRLQTLADELRRWSSTIIDAAGDDEGEEQMNVEGYVQWMDGIAHSLTDNVTRESRRGNWQYKPEALLMAFQTCQLLKDKSSFPKVVQRCIDLTAPAALKDTLKQRMMNNGNGNVSGPSAIPSATTVRRSALSVDGSYMGLLKEADEFANANIHVVADSSPQGNHDWLNSSFEYVKEERFVELIKAVHYLMLNHAPRSNHESDSDEDIDILLVEQRAHNGQVVVNAIKKHTQAARPHFSFVCVAVRQSKCWCC